MDKYGKPWENISFQEFQDIIHYREAERVMEIEWLKKTRDDLKLLLVDRTSLDNWIYAMKLQDKGMIESINPPIYTKSYDHVIYLNEPIGNYKTDLFSIYQEPDFKEMFDKYINHCYPDAYVFRNYKDDQQEIDLLLSELLE